MSPRKIIHRKKKVGNIFFKIGILLIFLGLVLFFLIFSPVVRDEVKYDLKPNKNAYLIPIKPINSDFGIVIPKILANTAVIANVDPFNQQEYQQALTKGVAQAKGSAYPGHTGNIFLFAHSSENWYLANRYNSVFYLLNKLVKDDDIYIYYRNKKYSYKVVYKKIVDASEISYLNPSSLSGPVLTLMTCWPPGTTFKRLIILAKII